MDKDISSKTKPTNNVINIEKSSFKLNPKENPLQHISSSITLNIHEDIFQRTPHPPTLLEKREKISIYSVDIYQNYPQVKKLRAFIKDIYSKRGYMGFSDLCDLYYDYYSKWFYAENDKGELLATMRLVLKDKNNLIPLEMGIVDSKTKSRYVVDAKHKVADINSFCFKRLHSIELLNGNIAKFCIKNNINTLYCMCDLLVPTIHKLYQRIGCLDSKTYNHPVYFPGYGRITNGEFSSTKWNIMEIPLTQLKKIAAKIKT